VALEALRGELTTAQLAARQGIHQAMFGEWKRQTVEGDGRGVFWQVRGRGDGEIN
jgi:hypothetical protein